MIGRIELARQLDYLREAGANKGLRVEAVQHWGGGAPGESWCCYFVTMILDIEFKGASPIPRLGRCQDVLELAQRKGWIIDQPEVGCLVLSVNATPRAHHIGICTAVSPLMTIAGNTSADGLSSDGDRVAEHVVSSRDKVFVRVRQ